MSPDGIDHFPVVIGKLARAHAGGPTVTVAELRPLRRRTLVTVADVDEGTLEHAVEFYRVPPRAELAVLPGTSHGLLVEKPALSNAVLVELVGADPVATYAPIRRPSARESAGASRSAR